MRFNFRRATNDLIEVMLAMICAFIFIGILALPPLLCWWLGGEGWAFVGTVFSILVLFIVLFFVSALE